MKKYQANSLELTGFLALEPKIYEQNAFLRLVCFYKKNKKETKPNGYFVDVSCFSRGMLERIINYRKGDKVHIRGKISSYKDQKTGFDKLSIIANRIWKISKQKQQIDHSLKTT